MRFLIAFLFVSTTLCAQQFGGERNQWQLNPEISVGGELFLTYDDRTEETEATVEEIELAFQTSLDPYTLMKVFFGIHQERDEGGHDEASFREEGHDHGWAVDVEEAYITWTAPFPGLRLDAGKFKQPFGTYNRWHAHALPMLEYPLYIRRFFGGEGLASTGLSADYLFGGLGTSELTLQGIHHAGENAFLGHYKSYWDLTPEIYLEGGLSYFSLDPEAYGADFTFLYEPSSQAKYSNFQIHGEWGRRDKAEGYLLLGERRFSAYWVLGAAYQMAQDLLEPDLETTAYSAVLTYWQSEFVRFRFHVVHETYSFSDDDDTRAILQVTFAAGPHKHEEY